MTREPEVALVLSAEEWVDALHRHCADHGGARVRCLVLDPAVALDEEFDVLVAGERWPALTRPFVDALHARGRRVLVVGDPARGVDLARRLGVDRLVDASSSPAELVAAVLDTVPPACRASDAPDGRRPVSSSLGERVLDEESAPGGGFVAVGGPWGAGSTEIALALAARWVRDGARPVVVDADPLTPSVAVRLGLPLEPNLCTAVDAAAFGLGAVPGALFDLGDDWPVVLVGVPNRRAAAALRGADVVAVGDVLAQRYSPVIFDVSAGTATDVDDPLGLDDPVAVIVARARVVVAVGTATPVGVLRLTEWIDAQRSHAPDAAVHVVVNRTPSSRGRRAELAHELQRGGRVSGLTFVPTDPRVEEAAWRASLVERGPFARAVDDVRRAVGALLDTEEERRSRVA